MPKGKRGLKAAGSSKRQNRIERARLSEEQGRDPVADIKSNTDPQKVQEQQEQQQQQKQPPGYYSQKKYDDEDVKRSLGPVEDTSKYDKQSGLAHIDPNGALPLRVERNKTQMNTNPGSSGALAQRWQALNNGKPSAAQPSGLSGPQAETDLTLYNMTDGKVRMVATLEDGRTETRTLDGKMGDKFIVPTGCQVTVYDDKTNKVLVKQVLTDTQTTLGVTSTGNAPGKDKVRWLVLGAISIGALMLLALGTFYIVSNIRGKKNRKLRQRFLNYP